MKKIFIAMALCLVCATFFSCDKKSKEQREVERRALECNMNLKEDKTAKVSLDNTQVIPHSAQIEYGDSLYHVARLYRNSKGRIIAYDIDSICVERRDYPEYNEYVVIVNVKSRDSNYSCKKNYTFYIHDGKDYDWWAYDHDVKIDKKAPIRRRYHLEGWELLFEDIREGGWYKSPRLSMGCSSVKLEQLN